MRLTALALVLCLVGLAAYVLWPPAAAEEVVQSEGGKSMMRDIEANRVETAEAGLLGGAAVPALLADGPPLPELPAGP